LAIGILAGSGQISDDFINDYVIMGELSLDGSINPIKGALPMAVQAKRDGFKGLIIPKENVEEAAMVDGIEILGANHLKEVIDHMNGDLSIKSWSGSSPEISNASNYDSLFDFSDVKGQESAKRAL